MTRHHDGLRSGRHRSLLAKMAKQKPRKRLRPRGFFGRWKWVLIPVLVLLLVPAMQVAVVRFINPPWTLPMWIDQGGAMFSSAQKRPPLYRWIGLPQIPEMSWSTFGFRKIIDSSSTKALIGRRWTSR